MTALIVIASVLLLLVLILSVRIRFIIKYTGDGLETYAEIPFFRFYLTGEPEKKLRLRDFKINRFRKRRDKAIKKYNDALAKKSKKKKKAKSDFAPVEKKKRFSSANELISTVKKLLDGVLVCFPRYLHIDIKRFVIEVGGDDAHQTAMLYGTAVQGMQYLIYGAGKCARLKKKNNASVGVTPNFINKCFRAEADITAHISVFGALKLGIKFISNYFKNKHRRINSVSKERTAR